MKIALDYDGTYTLNKQFWDDFIDMTRFYKDVDIRIVSHRHEELDKIDTNTLVIYTDGVAKKWYCEHRGDRWVPDIWIDDKPKGIFENGPLTDEQVEEWRKTRG